MNTVLNHVGDEINMRIGAVCERLEVVRSAVTVVNLPATVELTLGAVDAADSEVLSAALFVFLISTLSDIS